jgi:hypothetical protein
VTVKFIRFILLFLATACALAAPPPTTPPPTAIERAFGRLYNFDFAGAHAILDEHKRLDPADPLSYSVAAAADLFAEMYRLKILETDFFIDDSKLIEKKKLKPDPALRAAIFKAVGGARQRAEAKLAVQPDDREALFALCMSAGVITDYTALVERRQWAALQLARETHAYAMKLLALNPPAYDAYHTLGMMEYVMGSVTFVVRWFVRFEQIQGSKQKGVQNLYLVIQYGRYYKPFSKILLSVIYLREKKPQEVEKLLAELVHDFPENPLFRAELSKVSEQVHAQVPAVQVK